MNSSFWENLQKKQLEISLEPYGKNDIFTGWEVKTLIDKKDDLSVIVNNFHSEDPLTMDGYLEYLYAKKLVSFVDILPCLAKEEDKAFLSWVIQYAKSFVDSVELGAVIRFINASIYDIAKQKEVIGFLKVTLDLIQKYWNGIDVETIRFLSDEYGYLLIQRYSSFGAFFEKHPDVFCVLFSDKNLEEYLTSWDAGVYEILSDIEKKADSPLKQTALIIEEKIYSTMRSLASTITEENALSMKRQIDSYSAFLRKTKSHKANEFDVIQKHMNQLIDGYIKRVGHSFSYEIPVGKILDRWNSIEVWEVKLLAITHDYNQDGWKSAKSRLAGGIPNSSKSFADLFTYDEKTDDYFTISRKNMISLRMSIGTGSMLGILHNNHDEFYGMLTSAVKYLSQRLNNEELFHDVQRMLLSVDFVLRNEQQERIIQEALIYNAAMQLCACTEKMMRLAYVAIYQNESYIPLKNATLGSLVSANGKEWLKLFNYDQLHTIGYYFVTMGDKSIGFNYRNVLAHLDYNVSEILYLENVGTLMYLFMDVMNTLFAHYRNIDVSTT